MLKKRGKIGDQNSSPFDEAVENCTRVAGNVLSALVPGRKLTKSDTHSNLPATTRST